MMKPLSKRILSFCFALVFLQASHTSGAADYCGQPVPHDIAQEGYHSVPTNFVENAFGDPNAQQLNQGQQQSLSGQAIYVPPGASIPLIVDRPIGSGFSRPGEIIYAHINSGAYGIPSGAIAELVVLMVEPAGRGFARPGRIQIGANRLILPNNQSIWLRGLVIDSQGKDKLVGQSGGSRFRNSFGKIALGAGLGAASGLASGAIANGNNLAPAIWLGTAIGTVIGGIWAATAKGKDVTLPTGMPVFLSVTQGTQTNY